ncbi:MBL fold metallo-hydrolase [Phenylobacterium sp.]|uniref:MBL fold metallo-hydrolase n=1 Tax=Phenylobacterium sp. TaxID=1871053 RepID=UPI00120B5B1E|nr:MBL fold metallo-hydrolase [Phenylobacterium sp.]THD61015.1 MAG: MBL fold metallo-hydrolase [Phenylobacterium sp.]
MKRWRMATLVVAAVILALAAGAYALRGRIAMAVMARLYAHAMGDDPYAGLGDGLHVGLCGSGSPMPDPTRAGPCTAILAGQRLFVVDVGAGAQKNLALMNLPPGRVEAVFLTHFHSDHIDGLGELMLQRWGTGANTSPLPVYGPTGVDQVVHGFEMAYGLDQGYRTAHHGPAVMPPSGFGGTPHPFAADRNGPDVVLIDDGGLKVTAFPVNHRPVEPAVGYRFDYKGRSVVVSGDTAPSPRLEAAAAHADVLVHEGLAPNLVAVQHDAAVKGGKDNLAHITHDILSYHTTPEQAAAIAQRAQVRYLLFTHIIPPLPLRALEGPWLGSARDIFHGTVRVGHDGDFLSLPAGSTEIRRTDRLAQFR